MVVGRVLSAMGRVAGNPCACPTAFNFDSGLSPAGEDATVAAKSRANFCAISLAALGAGPGKWPLRNWGRAGQGHGIDRD
jgi:hypothetical protein